MELIQDKDISIREMLDQEEDYKQIQKWLSQTEVKEWYENREGLTLEAIRSKYRPRVLHENHVHSCIIELEGKPVGYLQFYETQLEKEYNQKEPLLEDAGVWAIDIFVGEPSHFGKGIGSGALKLILDFLVKEKKARKIIIDPDVRNERAIRAYEKAGFTKQKILKQWEQHEGEWTDAWLMCYEPTTHEN